MPAGVRAQTSNGNGIQGFLDNLFTGSIAKGGQGASLAARGGSEQLQPAPKQPASSAALPWSGEDGASGHPLMTANAIRQAAANFPNCVAAMWPDAARRHITRENFERFTAGLSPDLRIMDLMDSQPEFTKAIWDYLDILVSDTRLARGREILATYKPQFDAVEKAYGVDRYAIAAIDGDGLTILERLRDEGHAPRSTIALTGHDDDELRERCIDAGCVGVLLKPVPIARLVELVRSL